MGRAMKIRIEQPDTDDRVITCWGTKVFSESGEEIKDISRLSVDFGCPKTGEHIVMATIEMAVNPSTIHAHAILGVDSLREAAKFHGYRLVREPNPAKTKPPNTVPPPPPRQARNSPPKPPPNTLVMDDCVPPWVMGVIAVGFFAMFAWGLYLILS